MHSNNSSDEPKHFTLPSNVNWSYYY